MTKVSRTRDDETSSPVASAGAWRVNSDGSATGFTSCVAEEGKRRRGITCCNLKYRVVCQRLLQSAYRGKTRRHRGTRAQRGHCGNAHARQRQGLRNGIAQREVGGEQHGKHETVGELLRRELRKGLTDESIKVKVSTQCNKHAPCSHGRRAKEAQGSTQTPGGCSQCHAQ